MQINRYLLKLVGLFANHNNEAIKVNYQGYNCHKLHLTMFVCFQLINFDIRHIREALGIL